MSKGSGRRPSDVSDEQLSSNWDAIFNKLNNQEDSTNERQRNAKESDDGQGKVRESERVPKQPSLYRGNQRNQSSAIC